MSKVLTVSYGTFSCTLEGFDDSFSTMKAIAEYFRDLAADDRYFGAEPATPDAEMLARIAEREVSHRVEAKMQEGGVVLRPSSNVAKIAAAAAAAAPAPEAEVAPKPQIEDVPAPEMEAEATPEMVEPAEVETTEAEAPAEAAEAPSIDDDSSVAAKLRRIRAVVQKADADEATALYSEDEHAAAFYQPPVEEAVEETAIDEAEESPASEEDATSRVISGLVSEADETGTEDEVAAEFEAETEEETATEDSDAEESAEEETAAELEPEAEEFEDEPEMAIADDESEAEEEAEEIEAAAEVEAEDEAESESEETAEVEDDESDLDAEIQAAADADLEEYEDDDVPEEAAYAASEEDEFEDTYETAPIAEDLEIAATGQDDEYEDEADDFALAATAEDDADASELSPEAEAELAAELADLEEGAEDEIVDEASDDEPPRDRKAHLEDGIGDDDAAVSRILDHTNSEMESSEGSRRRSAIAHLKAAVAATRADGRDRPSKEAESAAEAAPYREDLADVVRPRRPLSRGRGERPRPAPLMLVSEQRVDLPENGEAAEPAQAIQPRRVTKGALALQADEADEGAADENVENLFNESNFENFATEMGATELPDLLEAAAAYVCLVEGRPHFSRPQVMRRASSVANLGEFSREDGLRSFGQLLRQGKINKKNRGEFTIAESTRFKPAERHATH